MINTRHLTFKDCEHDDFQKKKEKNTKVWYNIKQSKNESKLEH